MSKTNILALKLCDCLKVVFSIIFEKKDNRKSLQNCPNLHTTKQNFKEIHWIPKIIPHSSAPKIPKNETLILQWSQIIDRLLTIHIRKISIPKKIWKLSQN